MSDCVDSPPPKPPGMNEDVYKAGMKAVAAARKRKKNGGHSFDEEECIGCPAYEDCKEGGDHEDIMERILGGRDPVTSISRIASLLENLLGGDLKLAMAISANNGLSPSSALDFAHHAKMGNRLLQLFLTGDEWEHFRGVVYITNTDVVKQVGTTTLVLASLLLHLHIGMAEDEWAKLADDFRPFILGLMNSMSHVDKGGSVEEGQALIPPIGDETTKDPPNYDDIQR